METISQLRDIVCNQQKCLYIRDICNLLGLHVSEARKIAQDFVDQESKNGTNLDVRYIVSGSEKHPEDDNIRVQRLKSVKADELEEAKKSFETLLSWAIDCVSLKNDEEKKELTSPISFKALLSKDDLIKAQKQTYILNDGIELREDLLQKYKLYAGIKENGIAQESVEVKEEKKENAKSPSEKPTENESKATKEKSKSSTNKQLKGRKKPQKQAKLSGFTSKGSKNDQSTTNSQVTPEAVKEEPLPDPFTDEEEEKEPMELELPSKAESDEDPIPSKVKRPVDSEDEAIVVEEQEKSLPKEKKANKEKKNKKRKRVRIYDSDEEDEEEIAARILAASDDEAIEDSADSGNAAQKSSGSTPKSSEPSQRMETQMVAESYVDEDGYTAVRYVKKLLPVETAKQEAEKCGEKEDVHSTEGDDIKSKSESNDKKGFTAIKEKNDAKEKRAHKKQKTAEEEAEGEEESVKPKAKGSRSKAAQAKKGQVSITSFFKPAVKS